MAGLDVICIGAINYDYMFHCSEEDLIQKDSNVGSEHLSNPISDVENDITELVMKNKQYTTQIGGSAFITAVAATAAGGGAAATGPTGDKGRENI